jgi:hypothetical protein
VMFRKIFRLRHKSKQIMRPDKDGPGVLFMPLLSHMYLDLFTLHILKRYQVVRKHYNT